MDIFLCNKNEEFKDQIKKIYYQSSSIGFDAQLIIGLGVIDLLPRLVRYRLVVYFISPALLPHEFEQLVEETHRGDKQAEDDQCDFEQGRSEAATLEF